MNVAAEIIRKDYGVQTHRVATAWDADGEECEWDEVESHTIQFTAKHPSDPGLMLEAWVRHDIGLPSEMLEMAEQRAMSDILKKWKEAADHQTAVLNRLRNLPESVKAMLVSGDFGDHKEKPDAGRTTP